MGFIFGFFWGLWVFFHSHLRPRQSSHNLRLDLHTETIGSFPFQSSSQLTPDTDNCRNTVYFNPEPSTAPLWTSPASTYLQKRYWLLNFKYLTSPDSGFSNACSHTHPLHYVGKTEPSPTDLNLAHPETALTWHTVTSWHCFTKKV